MTNTSGNEMDIFVAKYDLSGQQIWFKTYGTSGMDAGNGITLDSNGNVYVVGTEYYLSTTSADIVVLKYDSSGNLLSTTIYDGGANDRGKGIVYNDVDNSIYVTGITRDTTVVGGLGLEAITIKYDTNLNQIWVEKYDYTSQVRPDGGLDIAIDGSGYIYVVGSSYVSVTNLQDILLLKYDSNGNQIWAETWNNDSSNDNDLGWRITVRNIPNIGWRIFIVGFSFSIVQNRYVLEVICYDTGGNYRWSVGFDNNGDVHFDMNTELFINAGINGDNSYIYVVGESKDRGSTGNDTFFLKYDGNGNKLDEKYWNHVGRDLGRDIVPDQNGWMYIVGAVYSGGYSNAYIMQTNTNGDVPEFPDMIPMVLITAIFIMIPVIIRRRE